MSIRAFFKNIKNLTDQKCLNDSLYNAQFSQSNQS